MELLIHYIFTFVVGCILVALGRYWGYRDGYIKGFEDGQKSLNEAYRRGGLFHDNY